MAELRRPPEPAAPVDVVARRAAVVNAADFEALVAAVAASGGQLMSAGRRRVLELVADDPQLARRLRATNKRPDRVRDAVDMARYKLAQHVHIADTIAREHHQPKETHHGHRPNN